MPFKMSIDIYLNQKQNADFQLDYNKVDGIRLAVAIINFYKYIK